MARSFRYNRASLHGDLALGLGGLIAGGIFTLAALETRFLLLLFASITVLAVYFTYNSLRRYWIEVEADEESITLFSRERKPVTISWADVATLKLRFFGSKSQREKGKGTLSLMIVDRNKRKITVESGLIDFEDLAKFSYAQSRAHDVEIDAVSLQNFQAVGVSFS